LFGKKKRKLNNQGGLGGLNLDIRNKALLIKYLHKFFDRHDIPWVNLIWHRYYPNGGIPGNHWEGSFWLKSILNLLDYYKAMARCNLGDGRPAFCFLNRFMAGKLYGAKAFLS
jgi:hypothetical protein